MISRRKVIGIVLTVLMIAQFVHLQSYFAEIETAENLVEEFDQPTVIDIGLFLVGGAIAALMTMFGLKGWRIGVITGFGLYVWAVWYPDFLHLVFKYGAWTVITGVLDNARTTGTLGQVLLHHVMYPIAFSGVLLATLWDFKSPEHSD